MTKWAWWLGWLRPGQETTHAASARPLRRIILAFAPLFVRRSWRQAPHTWPDRAACGSRPKSASPLSGGTLVLTAGIIALGRERQQIILDVFAAFERFDADNDLYGEHDFGALEAAGAQVFFKIDYLDCSRGCASLDSAAASVTRGVLTVMLAGEY